MLYALHLYSILSTLLSLIYTLLSTLLSLLSITPAAAHPPKSDNPYTPHQ